MNSLLQEIQSLLVKPYHDLEFLLHCLREVLEENNEHGLAEQIPWISVKIQEFNEENTAKLLHLHSICFQLLNLAEVNGAAICFFHGKGGTINPLRQNSYIYSNNRKY